MDEGLKVDWLGRVSFEDGLQIQSELVERKAGDPELADQLFLLEHEPIYTVGRSVSLEDPEFRELPYPALQINRGGKVTYHGPGQLVGYAVLDLRLRGQDLHRHLRLLEAGLIDTARHFGVSSHLRDSLTGVWCGERKLASLGVGVRRWVTMHGFALNVCGALDGFNYISPCGLAGVSVTSLEQEGAGHISVKDVAAKAAEIFKRLL
jgi:lipoyl(octanoyl) transferase